jgi:hypothetical protein
LLEQKQKFQKIPTFTRFDLNLKSRHDLNLNKKTSESGLIAEPPPQATLIFTLTALPTKKQLPRKKELDAI